MIATIAPTRNVRREPEPEPQPPHTAGARLRRGHLSPFRSRHPTRSPQPVPQPPPDPSPPPPTGTWLSFGPSEAAEGGRVCRPRRLGYRIYVLPEIDLRLRPDANSPAEARRSLEALRPSLNDLLVDDAVLLVSEIVSNSVRHASLDETDAIEVRVRGSRFDASSRRHRSGPGVRPRARPTR